MRSARRSLIELRRLHGLTDADVASLAGVRIKTVAAWMAKPGSAGAREIPAYRLDVIENRIEGNPQ